MAEYHEQMLEDEADRARRGGKSPDFDNEYDRRHKRERYQVSSTLTSTNNTNAAAMMIGHKNRYCFGSKNSCLKNIFFCNTGKCIL